MESKMTFSNKKNKMLFLLALFAILTMMCGPNLDTESYAKEKPKRKDLVGKYIPTESTWKFIRDEGHYEVSEISIQIFPDGSYKITNMPDWLNPSGKSGGKLRSSGGEYSIVQEQEWWELQLNGYYGVPIQGDAPPYRLWFYVGDPDSGDIMIFEQVMDK